MINPFKILFALGIIFLFLPVTVVLSDLLDGGLGYDIIIYFMFRSLTFFFVYLLLGTTMVFVSLIFWKMKNYYKLSIIAFALSILNLILLFILLDFYFFFVSHGQTFISIPSQMTQQTINSSLTYIFFIGLLFSLVVNIVSLVGLKKSQLHKGKIFSITGLIITVLTILFTLLFTLASFFIVLAAL